jgi:hypothetical protein
MAYDANSNGRPGVLRPIAHLGGRAALSTLRPFSGAFGMALGAGRSLERRAVDRALDSGELERILAAAMDSARLQTAMQLILDSAGAKRLIDTFFDSGLLDYFLERLIQSDALWRLVDEIAASPTVTAAISQQGLGFADEVGEEVRARSRKADDWLERAARRLIRRDPSPAPPPPQPGPST